VVYGYKIEPKELIINQNDVFFLKCDEYIQFGTYQKSFVSKIYPFHTDVLPCSIPLVQMPLKTYLE
jgi:hypothetical protein